VSEHPQHLPNRFALQALFTQPYGPIPVERFNRIKPTWVTSTITSSVPVSMI
jgi:hypothetical protein